jgi:hypothetical protein
MRLTRYINEAFNNWTFPDDKTMKSDFSEYKKKEKKKWFSRSKMMGMRWPLFKDFNHFRHSLRTADVVKLTPSLDSKITNRSHSHSIEDLKQLVNGYIRPRDVDRIVDGFESNDRIPYPIVLRTRRGMWIMAGNTRLDASFIMDITPTILIVDVDAEIGEAKTSMQIWREKARKKELALSSPERIKDIEKHLVGTIEGYKHPDSIEDLKFLKKFKPGSFWKRLSSIVIQQHHPTKHDEIMKFLRKNIK